jgi:thioredoxin reductase
VAELTEPGDSARDGASGAAGGPHPPGTYPVVVVGSGPGGLQVAYSLRALGVPYAHLSADTEAGGMFRTFPFFQRLLSWTKLHAPFPRGSRGYEWYDWNSLLGDTSDDRALMPELMEGTSSFPSRPEMQRNLELFAERAALQIRYGTRWERTRREDDGTFVLETTDGEYRCGVAVFAVGAAEPFTPQTPGLDQVPHYVDTRPAETYAGKRVFVVGKQNSAFELATGLLPVARSIVLASPRPPTLSVNAHSLNGIRARYVQPWEDHIVGGGVTSLNAAIDRVDRGADGYRIQLRRTDADVSMEVEADEVIAATGFVCPLQDLPALGVATYGQQRWPVLTPWWESATVPGIYFAGTIGQAAPGMKKWGLPANSGAVHGARYNARIIAGRIAERHLGQRRARPEVPADRLVPFLLDEASRAPELWNQKSYLCRVVTRDADGVLRDDGIQPLQPFVDGGGQDAVAIAVEENDRDAIYPALYVRQGGSVGADVELAPDPLHRFDQQPYQTELRSRLAAFLG